MQNAMYSVRGYVRESWSRFRWQIALRHVDQQSPIIVYQMGKVGSSTVVSTLEKLELPNPILHVHTLVADQLSAAKSRQRASARPFIDTHLIVSTILISKLAQGRLPCRLITLTREPISRAISFAFEDWHTKAPDARLANGSLDADALTSAVDRMLRSGGSHADPGQWFDNELKRTFGLDVFSIPYDERRGYSIMRHPGVELLILRMEDMNRSLPAALAEFLGIAADRIVISPANESDGKWYSEAANTVKQTFRVPEELLNTLLSSRFIRHFYPNDVDRLRKRWGQ